VNIAHDTTVERAHEVVAATVGDKLLMMSVELGGYFALSAVTARIWELLATPMSVDEVVAHLVDEYEVEPQVCLREVTQVVEGLVSDGLLRARASS
jgi:hypothetical protein